MYYNLFEKWSEQKEQNQNLHALFENIFSIGKKSELITLLRCILVYFIAQLTELSEFQLFSSHTYLVISKTESSLLLECIGMTHLPYWAPCVCAQGFVVGGVGAGI